MLPRLQALWREERGGETHPGGEHSTWKALEEVIVREASTVPADACTCIFLCVCACCACVHACACVHSMCVRACMCVHACGGQKPMGGSGPLHPVVLGMELRWSGLVRVSSPGASLQPRAGILLAGTEGSNSRWWRTVKTVM